MDQIFARASMREDQNPAEPYYISNCGYYRSMDYEITIRRPYGRRDYQMLFPMKGMIQIGNSLLKPGEVYFFLPYEKQIYTYQTGEDTEYYFMHFEGREAASLMESLHLHSGVFPVGENNLKIAKILRIALPEIANGYPDMDAFTSGLCRAALTLVSNPPQTAAPFAKAVRLLEAPESTVTVAELASLYKMSTPHFIRSFKTYMGVPPLVYRTRKLLETACQMLNETTLTIEKIAQAVGYTDPFYFSRLFKKTYGVSPKEFRRQNRIS